MSLEEDFNKIAGELPTPKEGGPSWSICYSNFPLPSKISSSAINVFKDALTRSGSQQNILEFGTHVGHSALLFLLLTKNKVTSIDFGIDVGVENLNKVSEVLNKYFPGRFNLIIGDTRQAKIKDEIAKYGPYDFALIDAGHNYECARNDIEIAKENNIRYMIVDDYNDIEEIRQAVADTNLKINQYYSEFHSEMRIGAVLCDAQELDCMVVIDAPFGFNDFSMTKLMNPNVRESLQTACKRWGIDFIETRKLNDYEKHFHPAFAKFSIIDSLFSVYRRIIFCDNDILIRESAPNPLLEFYDENKFYAVKDMNHYGMCENNPMYLKIKYGSQLRFFNYALNKYKTNIDTKYYLQNYFNSGFFIVSNPLKHVFSRLKSIKYVNEPRYCIYNPLAEQTLLNVAILSDFNRFVNMGQKWNHVGFDFNNQAEDLYSNSYILHFTGTNTIKKKIDKFPWKDV